MDDTGFLIVAIFAAMLALAWLALYFGSRWFSARQNETAAHAKADLEGMFIFTDANRIMALNLAVLIVLPVVAWVLTGNVVLVLMCVVLAFVAPRFVVRYIARRRLRQFEQQLPDALMMITGALRAGASLPIALDSVASEGKPPISQEFALLLRELRLGVDFAVALEAMEKRVPLADLALVTSGMALSREVGANLAETLESIAKTIRAKLQMEGKIRSLTAQGKMQGIVMAGLPVLLIFILNMMEPEAMAPLFHAWYGWVTLAVMTVTIGIGYHFIRRITTIDV
ncbi:MAG: type II secretion system F family protein [Pseudomonadota bacterium]